MNIFVTDKDPVIAAANLDDSRVIKMALESAQLLSNALPAEIAPYKRTHYNHPCSVWARTSGAGYTWLYAHFIALCSEYTRRFGKIHACERLKDTFKLFVAEVDLPKNFPNCTPYKDMEVISAYKKTLNDKWRDGKRKPKWTNAEAPSWKES